LSGFCFIMLLSLEGQTILKQKINKFLNKKGKTKMKENKMGAEGMNLTPEEMRNLHGNEAAMMSAASETCSECLDSNTKETAIGIN